MNSQVVVAYHGCDFSTAAKVISDDVVHLAPSRNPYDWLGEGVYFFEDDLIRAKLFAQAAAASPHLKLTAKPIRRPYAIGALLTLGNCLDLSKQPGIDELMSAYEVLERELPSGYALPTNRKAGEDDAEGILHNLDRAVINYIHGRRIAKCLPPYDTVRGFFPQGAQAFPTSAIRRLSHAQIAVRNVSCILGYFHPKLSIDDPFQGLNRHVATPYRKSVR